MADPILKGHPPGRSWVRYQVTLALCVAAAISYVCRNTISVAESTIRSDLGLTKEQTGLLMGAFFLPYALGQIPAGLLAHNKGTRYCMPLFAMCWSVATLMFGKVATLGGLIAARAGQGLSQAGIFPCATSSIAHWFPISERAFPSGALASFMSLGGAIGVWIAGLMIVDERIGWRGMYLIFSLPGFLFAAWFLVWFRDRPEEHPSMRAEEMAHIAAGRTISSTTESESTPWWQLLTSPATIWICGQQFCRAGAVMFFSSWFATYLQEQHKASIPKSGFLSMLPLVGIVVGGITGGTVVDAIYRRTGSIRLSRQGVAIISSLICAVCIACALLVHDPIPAVLLISVGSMFAGAAGPCGYTITVDMGGRHVAPLFATMNMAGNIGALGFTVVVPYIQRAVGWDGVMMVFGALFIVSAFCWWMLDSSGTVFGQSISKSQGHNAAR